MHPQIPLPLQLHDDYNFDNFIAGNNSLILRSLQTLDDTFIFLWGDAGTGKTHLLQAACQHASTLNKTTSYLPLQDLLDFSPNILDGMESVNLICIDDIDAINGNATWEEGIFNLFNNLKQQGGQLIVSSKTSPQYLPLALSDLKSRLCSCLPLNIYPLDNESTIKAMQHRAKSLGLVLNSDVAEFILSRFPRDLPTLWRLLQRLNHASLAAQRKLTIPFVKLTLLN
ncbi:MAG: DnaA regulatory inactivator Hda [Piscirickettsiaceae bacterium]|nr:MAG: DnaA regulatory inactivator Hda [Piscirickettsiaceae bacterium]